jgi:high-affinity Fe2+/Pb2+ permease
MSGENPSHSLRPDATRWIMLAVLVWGLGLALGAYLYGGRMALPRAAMIAACSLAFLGFWLAALAFRRRQQKREA